MNTDSILLPLIPLRGITIFPNMIIHFDIGREKSIASLEEAMLQEGKIFLVTQKDPEVELPTEKEDMYSIGTICKIKQILKLPKGTTRVLVEGIERARLLEFEEKDNHLRGVVEKISEAEKNVETNEDPILANFAMILSILVPPVGLILSLFGKHDYISRRLWKRCNCSFVFSIILSIALIAGIITFALYRK